MDKIKILQFPIANSNGGITHYALGNWQWMDKSRFQCDFATMSKSLDFADDILATGSKIHYISCYAEENPEKFEEEFCRILEEGYDVVPSSYKAVEKPDNREAVQGLSCK